MDHRLIPTLLLLAIIALAVYRRARRTFGRQPVNVARMWLRIGVLLLIGALLTFSVQRSAALIGAMLAGVACGALLSQVALRHTTFETTAQGRFYTPHSYIGLALTAVFLGRLMFRLFSVYSQIHLAGPTHPRPLAGVQNSASTIGIAGLLIGYYALYNFAVLRKSP